MYMRDKGFLVNSYRPLVSKTAAFAECFYVQNTINFLLLFAPLNFKKTLKTN